MFGYGNSDGSELRRRLPDVGRAGTGGGEGRERWMAAAYPDVDLLIFGNSHIPWDSVTATGLRLLVNPGSPTKRRRQPLCTYLTLTRADGRVGDVRLHRVSSR